MYKLDSLCGSVYSLLYVSAAHELARKKMDMVSKVDAIDETKKI